MDVRIDPAQLAEIYRLASGIKNGVPNIIRRAINKVTNSQFTAIRRLLAKKTGFKQAAVASAMKKVLANYNNLNALLRVRSRGIPVRVLKPKGKFPSRGKGEGITYLDPITGQRKLIPGAFFANAYGNDRDVFVRKYRGQNVSQIAAHASKFKGDSRLLGRFPIVRQYGPNMTAVFQPEVDRVRADTAAKLAREVEVQTQLVIERAQVSNANT